MQITLFPKALLDLQRELMHPAHTEFNRKFSQRPRPFDEIIQDMCTHFEIIVDGMYDKDAQNRLAEIITKKLEDQRLNAIANVNLTRH